MKKTQQKTIKNTIIILGVLLAMIVASKIIDYIFGTPCFSIYLLNIPCPFCGMTRAYESLLNGNIELAFKYNPLFFLGVPFIIFILWPNLYNKYPKIFKSVLIGITLLFFVMNIFRIFGWFGFYYIP